MKLSARLEKAIDSIGLLIALVVDLVINVICFATLAPDLITSIAFIAIGIMSVLFVFRSWAKRSLFAWVVFVSVVFFFDFSFSLEATRTQSNETTIENDAELIRLTIKADEYANQVKALQEQYDKAMKRETLIEIDAQKKVAQDKADSFESERKARMSRIEKGTAKVQIKSSDVFRAIPQAFADKRYIQLVIFALIFLGLQLIVVTSIDPEGKEVSVIVKPMRRKKRTVSKKPIVETQPESMPDHVADISETMPVITDDMITDFVEYGWYSIRQKTSEFIVNESTFFDLMKRQNKPYNLQVYKYLLGQCKRMKIIDDDGKTNMDNEGAIRLLLGNVNK